MRVAVRIFTDTCEERRLCVAVCVAVCIAVCVAVCVAVRCAAYDCLSSPHFCMPIINAYVSHD